MNRLVCGDNLDVLAGLEDSSVDLAYLDPPFATGRDWHVSKGGDDWGVGFRDRLTGGDYVDSVRAVVCEVWRVLKPSGSVYLHCDPTMSHYLKVMMDEVFGINNYLNEIVWRRHTAHNNVKRRYGCVHDVLLFYSRSGNYYFDRQEDPIKPSWIADKHQRVRCDADGRPWIPQHLGGRTGPGKGAHYYEVLGYKGYWMWKKETMQEKIEDGLVVCPGPGLRPVYKYYIDEVTGVVAQDVWDNMLLVSSSRERTGYPTQKPLRLLERVVQASCPVGGVVLDPYVGSGTCLVAADRHGRGWIGIDRNEGAVDIAERRLEEQKSLLSAPFVRV